MRATQAAHSQEQEKRARKAAHLEEQEVSARQAAPFDPQEVSASQAAHRQEERASQAAPSHEEQEEECGDAELTELFMMIAPQCTTEKRAELLEISSLRLRGGSASKRQRFWCT